MKSFRFSLQSLLTLRQREERTAMERYAQALLARQRAVEDLDAVSRELANVWLRCSTELMAGCRAGDVVRSHQHGQRMEGERQRFGLAVAAAERATDLALHGLLAARQAREMVDQHRGHQRVDHDRALNREEQRFLDDLVTRRVAPGLAWQAAGTN